MQTSFFLLFCLRTGFSLCIVYDRQACRTLSVHLNVSSSLLLTDSFVQFISITIKFTLCSSREGLFTHRSSSAWVCVEEVFVANSKHDE